MEFWTIYIIITMISVFLEALIPKVIFINLAFASIITAIVSIFWGNLITLTAIMFGMFVVMCFTLRPILKRILKINSPYIYKVVKTTELISSTQGKLIIDDKTFEARVIDGEEEIPIDVDVKIIKVDKEIFYVKRAS